MSLNLKYVYPPKAEEIQRLYNSFELRKSSVVTIYKNATIFPIVNYNDYDVSCGRGGVLDSNENYIEESKTKARIEGKYSIDKNKCEFIDKKVVFCGHFRKQWGHYITECISRLWYVLENDTSIDKYVFIVEDGSDVEFSGNYLTFLELLGIDKKIQIINKPTVFKEVVIPEEGFVYGEYYTNKYVEMYDCICQKALLLYKGPRYDRIFFSKSLLPYNSRDNLNFKLVDKYFEKNGFKTLYPEKMTLIDTIGAIQNAKMFATVTSSPAHNAVFSPKNQIMISIEKQAFLNPYQIFVTKISSCNTIFVDAYRFIFPIETSGPFIFDYTDFWIKYSNDNGMNHCKTMNSHQFKRIYKRYMRFYFSSNYNMPPDYLYKKYNLDTMRLAYNDTIKYYYKVLKPCIHQRLSVKVKNFLLKHFRIVLQ